jgi:uncharacterized membrane protein
LNKQRLEAFSDGVIAIIITIMVLELKVPHSVEFSALQPLIPVLLSYILSFIFLGIYWSNHHHLLQAVKNVSGTVLWANLHLLFWLSLVPFVTGWMGENHFAALPVAFYGIVLLGAAIAYFILVQVLLSYHKKDSILATAIGNDTKGKISVVLYMTAIISCLLNPLYACAIYVLVAIIWLAPDKRIEKVMIDHNGIK